MKIYMKKLFLIVVLLCFAHLLSAQSVVRGRVVDKSGLPIPGARVSVKGTHESALTDFDGTYLLITDEDVKKVTVDYVGFNTRKVKVKDAGHIALAKTNFWNDVRGNNWMVAFQMAFLELDRSNSKIQPSYGAMVGWCKNFGGYAKLLWRGGSVESGKGMYNPLDCWTTGQYNLYYRSITAGAVVRMMSPFHIYAGVGVCSQLVEFEMAGAGYYYDVNPKLSGTWYYGLDFGVIFKIRYFMLSAGTCISPNLFHRDLANPSSYTTSAGGVVGNFGIGISF